MSLAWVGIAATTATGLACNDDNDPGGSASGTDSGSATEITATTGEATAASATAASSSAEGGSSGTSEAGTTTGGAAEVLLGGQTRDFIGNDAIPGTAMRVFGRDDLTDVAGPDGAFELGPLPADTPVAIVLEPVTVDSIDYVGAVVPERTGTADRSDVVATQIGQRIIDEQIMFLQAQDPAPADLEQAIVIVLVNPFEGGESLADGTITVTMDPPPDPGTFYAPAANGDPVLDSNVIGFEALPAAVFFNLPDRDMGETTVTVAHENPQQWACEVDFPIWPTVGGHTTFVLVTCVE